jgi:hypothetical protein
MYMGGEKMTASAKKHTLLFLTTGLLVTFLSLGQRIGEAVLGALLLVGGRIIPSLFPFLVLSGILVAACDGLSLPGERLFSRVFGLPHEAYPAFFLGALCGFPIGARCTADLFRRGSLTREEAAQCAALSANSGPAFAVAAIGGNFFGSDGLGWLLYVTQILSAILLGFLLRAKGQKTARADLPRDAEFSLDLASILGRATLSMLNIAGCVIFFAALSVLPSLLLPRPVAALLCAVLEVTGGAAAAAALPLGYGLPIAAFALSFSGVCVLLQSSAELVPLGISTRPLILRKLLQGGLSAIAVSLLIWLWL